jgi:hypothetical protein
MVNLGIALAKRSIAIFEIKFALGDFASQTACSAKGFVDLFAPHSALSAPMDDELASLGTLKARQL